MKSRTRLILAGLMALAATATVGCGSLNAEFARSANAFANDIGGEYAQVLNGQRDVQQMTEVQRQVRLDRITAQQRLTADAVQATTPGD